MYVVCLALYVASGSSGAPPPPYPTPPCTTARSLAVNFPDTGQPTSREPSLPSPPAHPFSGVPGTVLYRYEGLHQYSSYSTVLYSTVYSTVQYCTVYSTVQYCTGTVVPGTVMYSMQITDSRPGRQVKYCIGTGDIYRLGLRILRLGGSE